MSTTASFGLSSVVQHAAHPTALEQREHWQSLPCAPLSRLVLPLQAMAISSDSGGACFWVLRGASHPLHDSWAEGGSDKLKKVLICLPVYPSIHLPTHLCSVSPLVTPSISSPYWWGFGGQVFVSVFTRVSGTVLFSLQLADCPWGSEG